jgi:hypothetical protein
MLSHIKWFVINVIDFSIYVLEYFHFWIEPISYIEKGYNCHISVTGNDSLPPLIDITNDDMLYEDYNENEDDHNDCNYDNVYHDIVGKEDNVIEKNNDDDSLPSLVDITKNDMLYEDEMIRDELYNTEII